MEILVFHVIILSFGLMLYSHKRKSDRNFRMVQDSWNSTLETFMEKNGITGMDLKFDVDSKKLKKKSNSKSSIKIIARDLPKGYDFFDVFYEKGYILGSHYHEFSNMFIYVISGKLEISGKSFDGARVLSDGECFYMPSGVYHQLEAKTNVRFIEITMPPIIRGVL